MYAGAGSIGTAAHFVVLLATHRNVGPVAASTIGAVVGCVINYLLAREIVFRSNAPYEGSFPRFAAVAIAGIAVNALVISMLVQFIPVTVSQMIATSAVLLLGYTANKNWTFNEN